MLVGVVEAVDESELEPPPQAVKPTSEHSIASRIILIDRAIGTSCYVARPPGRQLLATLKEGPQSKVNKRQWRGCLERAKPLRFGAI